MEAERGYPVPVYTLTEIEMPVIPPAASGIVRQPEGNFSLNNIGCCLKLLIDYRLTIAFICRLSVLSRGV